MNKNAKLITVSAVTLALTVVLGALPLVFLVPLIFTSVTRGYKMTVISSLFFGVVSYLYAFVGGSVVAVAFIDNPWIAIVPRLIVGLLCHSAYVLAKKFIKGDSRLKRALPVSIAATVGSLANTALIVACLMLFASDTAFEGALLPVYVGTMLISGVIELAAVNLIVPPLALTVGRALKLEDYKIAPKIHNKQDVREKI